MPAYSFKERFIPMLKDGSKRQTIRNRRRKGGAKVGDTIYLYFGMRTKWCTKIGEGICTRIEQIKIQQVRGTVIVLVNGGKLSETGRERLAMADGFESWEVMRRWWLQNNGLPFEGDIIYWEKVMSEINRHTILIGRLHKLETLQTKMVNFMNGRVFGGELPDYII